MEEKNVRNEGYLPVSVEMTEVEKIVDKFFDVSSELDTVLNPTAKEVLDVKLHLIEQADDLSTKEKLEAICQAEKENREDEIHRNMIIKDNKWTKYLWCAAGAGLLLVCYVGGRGGFGFVSKNVA